MKRFITFILMLFLVVGCSAENHETPAAEPVLTDTNTEAAVELVQSYLSALAEGDYAAAADHYGGSYEVLAGYNPDIDLTNQAALLERACTVNGFQCLPVRRVVETAVPSPDRFQVTVEFSLPDGTLFELGPCCGASPEESPPVSQFAFTVAPDAAGVLRVQDLPVYQP